MHCAGGFLPNLEIRMRWQSIIISVIIILRAMFSGNYGPSKGKEPDRRWYAVSGCNLTLAAKDRNLVRLLIGQYIDNNSTSIYTIYEHQERDELR